MKETRIAIVMNGGVSLSVWMGGVTHELNRLRLAAGNVEPKDGRETAVHLAWKAILGHRRVVVDHIAGTSAGGLNGTLLATAVARGADLDDLKHIWLNSASLEPKKLLREHPQGAKSLLDGDFFTDEINDVLSKISNGAAGRYPQEEVTLLVTATGLGANLAKMRLEGDLEDSYSDSRRVFRFRRRLKHDESELVNDFKVPGPQVRDGVPTCALARAARASASFPTAFVPVMEDEPLKAMRAPGSADVGMSKLMDGGVLDNAPFGPLVEALQQRPVDAAFDRVVLYVVPSVSARKLARLGNDDLPDIGNVIQAVASTVREPDQRLDVKLLEDAFDQMSYQRTTTHAVLAEALMGKARDRRALQNAARPLFEIYRKGRAEALHRWLTGLGEPINLTRPQMIEADPQDISVIPPRLGEGQVNPFLPGTPWAWGTSTAERVLRWLGRALVTMSSGSPQDAPRDEALAPAFH